MRRHPARLLTVLAVLAAAFATPGRRPARRGPTTGIRPPTSTSP
ncbi:hypothetical protein ACF08O_28495 [Streptomyces paradoxus]